MQQVDRDTGIQSNWSFPFSKPHKSRLPLSHIAFKNFFSNLQKLLDGVGSTLYIKCMFICLCYFQKEESGFRKHRNIIIANPPPLCNRSKIHFGFQTTRSGFSLFKKINRKDGCWKKFE